MREDTQCQPLVYTHTHTRIYTYTKQHLNIHTQKIYTYNKKLENSQGEALRILAPSLNAKATTSILGHCATNRCGSSRHT